MTQLTERYTRAVDYARTAHAAHYRKGTAIPYLYHLLGVSSMVLEYGGDEDQAIAGLLHDVLEDCGHEHDARIEAAFGPGVIAIVRDCTDGTAGDKAAATTPEAKRADWQRRKLAYLAHLADEPEASLLVGACDKLHNARAIVADLEGATGAAVFERFTAGREGTLRYYEAIAGLLKRRAPDAGNPRFGELVDAFDRTVARMHALAGAATREALA